MNLTERALHAFLAECPLRITYAQWKDPILLLAGSGWRLRVCASWRLSDGIRMIIGSDDAAAEDAITQLVGTNIDKCKAQTGIAILDPALELSNGLFLEIFSSSALEPWVLSLPSGSIYVAAPADNR